MPEKSSTILLTAAGIQNTVFMSAFGIPTVRVSSASQVSVQSNVQGMELVLVLDNTGSMNCDVSDQNPPLPCSLTPNSKIVVLKQAVADLLNILYGSVNDTAPNLWVGVVPFSQAVNIGTNHLSWMDPNDPSLTADWRNGENASQGWAGCVMARSVSWYNGENVSDDPPGTAGTAGNPNSPPWNQTYFERYYFPSTAANTSGQCQGPAFNNDLTDLIRGCARPQEPIPQPRICRRLILSTSDPTFSVPSRLPR